MGERGVTKVQCNPLHVMLRDTIGNRHVDFWSLDVEGHERAVLEATDWRRVHVKVLMVEDFWVSNRQLDFQLSQNAMVKAHQLAIDSLYVHLHDASLLPKKRWWYPSGFHKTWRDNEHYRTLVRSRLANDL